MKYSILVVDDEIDNLQLFVRTFRTKYQVLTANSAMEGLEVLKNNKIDVIVSDHKMPEMDGVEFLTRCLEMRPDAIRILLTAYTDASTLISAINSAKIYRYLKKPWSIPDLTNTIESSLEIYQLNIDNQELTYDLKELFSGTITAITNALDAKDSFTFGRSKRVTYYSIKTGKYLGLSDSDLSELELAGLLHDIGMIGIPEIILNKPSSLSNEEYAEVKKHVNYGVKILEEIKQFDSVIKIIKLHHTYFNGNGYPDDIHPEQIPVGAKILAVADAYDSMTSNRPYRKGLSHESAIAEIREFTGTQFDPTVVNAFIAVINDAVAEINQLKARQT